MLKYALFASTLISQLALFADTSLGESLEREYWENTKKRNWKAIEDSTASCYQTVLVDEVLKKEQAINLLKKLNVTDYTISDFLVTESPGTIIVSYAIAVSESFEGRPAISKANRLSVWQKNDNKWQIIAHATLIPMVPSTAAQK